MRGLPALCRAATGGGGGCVLLDAPVDELCPGFPPEGIMIGPLLETGAHVGCGTCVGFWVTAGFVSGGKVVLGFVLVFVPLLFGFVPLLPSE